MSIETPLPIKEIMARVKHLEIRARKLVQESLQSEYHSVFKGRGVEFNEVRNYFPGDDVRDIDWNVTARMREPYLKTYIEERELSVVFAVDISLSGAFGGRKSKREMMAEIASLLGFAAHFNNDRVSLCLFSSDIESVIPPRRDYSHVLRIIRDIWVRRPGLSGTSLERSFRSLSSLLKKRAIIFILSDFLDAGYEKALASLARRHEVIPIVVSDSLEEEWADPVVPPWLSGPCVLADIEDLETGQSRTLDLDLQSVTELDRYRSVYRNLFKKLGLDYAEVSEKIDYFRTMEMLLRKRAHSRGGGFRFSEKAVSTLAREKETLIIHDRKGSRARLSRAAEILRDGGLVVFPTETVYGLGANALDPRAVHRIFEAKGRPADNPLIVHIADAADLPRVAVNAPPLAMKLLSVFSPGPFTLVLPRARAISDAVTAGLPTVAVRIPSHPVARALIREAGVPVAAPSANRSGSLSPTTFEMAFEGMNGRADCIIDGGNCDVGLESTVVTVTGNKISILRPGSVTEEMISSALAAMGEKSPAESADMLDSSAPAAPGMKYAHYQPRAACYLADRLELDRLVAMFIDKKLAVMGLDIRSPYPSTQKGVILAARFESARAYAHGLYSTMASFDSCGADVIVAQALPEKGMGRAIMNRLRKSSAGRTISYKDL